MAKAPANPEQTASCCSKLFFGYLNDLFRLGAQRPLLLSDIPVPIDADEAGAACARFDAEWRKSDLDALAAMRPRERSVKAITGAARRFVGTPVLRSSLYYLLSSVLQFAPPFLLKMLVSHLEGSAAYSTLVLWLLVAGMLVLPPIQSLILSQHNAIMARAGVQLRTALSTQIFRKGLVLSNAARQSKDTGEIVNVLSNDAVKPVRFFLFANALWANPLIVGACLYLIGREVGAAFWFAFLALFLAFIPLMFVFKAVAKLRVGILGYSDKRVKLMSEILSGIKVIKLYAWDQAFADKIQGIRVDEVRLLKILAYVVGLAFSIMLGSLPLMLPVIVFSAAATITGTVITASKAFTVIALFNILRFPFAFFPLAAVQWVTTVIALRRVQDFLLLGELDNSEDNAKRLEDAMQDPTAHAIELDSASFTWDRPAYKPKKKGGSAKGGGRGRRGKGKRPPRKSKKERAAAKQKELEAEAAYENLPAPDPSISNTSIRIRKGELVAVVGPVGSGKSTLLQGILGEVPLSNGTVARTGTIAYCAQQPWIMNCKLRENVTFDGLAKPDAARYEEAIKVCAMESDIKQITGGNDAEIGERGINLSGGQKARVSLARAVYSDRDVYLLDDPLSAVDTHVAEHIFDQCITGKLAKKTVVLVTHAVQFLPRCDKVIVLGGGDKAGTIVAQGTFEELVAQGVDLQMETSSLPSESAAEDVADQTESLKVQVVEVKENETAVGPIKRSTSAASASTSTLRQRSTSSDRANLSKKQRSDSTVSVTSSNGKLVEDEERTTGDVSASAYWTYFRAAGWGYFVLFFIASISARACELLMPFILSLWSDYNVAECQRLSPENVTFGRIDVQDCALPISEGTDNKTYLNWYGIAGGASVCFVAVRGLVTAAGRVRASRVLHEALIKSVLRAPMSFFDTTPLGRILNRFSSDIEVIDSELGSAMVQVSSSLMNVVGALTAITAATRGLFAPMGLPIMYLYYSISKYYRKSSTEIKRLESLSRSPVFALFSEVLTGSATIRAYGQENRIVKTNDGRFNQNTSALILLSLAGEWLSIRLDMTSAAISFFVAVYAVTTIGTAWAIPAGWVGLSLSFSFEMTAYLKHSVRMYAQLEASMNAVERVVYYTKSLPIEGKQVAEALTTKGNGKTAAGEVEIVATADLADVDDSWPQHGAIEASGFQLRYRPNLPLVLKGLDFKINGGERVGVVGRTGAGKSTLMLALYRLVEAAGGSIRIDGVSIAGVDLNRLRSALAIIPQDPVLWSCSIRDNLDPFGTVGDEGIWESLERVGLKTLLSDTSAYPNGLDFDVTEGGANFSVGQRQLFCIARALLRKSKVLLLDEATASIDRETDRFIQKMIRSSFDGVTILTIAHRLNTIMDFDRILVFDDGKIKEFDSPMNLLEKQGGSFRAMVEATGEESARVLRDIAKGDMDALALESDITMDQVNEASPELEEAGDAESKNV